MKKYLFISLLMMSLVLTVGCERAGETLAELKEDLDIYLSIDPMMPMYKVGIILDLVSDLCQKFDFFIYNILFENVSEYKRDLILKSYEAIREIYKNKFPMEYTSLNYVPKDKVNDVFK